MRKVNPFYQDLQLVRLTKKERVVAVGNPVDVVDSKTGEFVTCMTKAVRERFEDREPFVKMYQKGLAVFSELSSPASSVLRYILSTMPFGDVFIFTVTECMDAIGYKSPSVVYNAISELKKKRVIAPTGVSKEFYLNPTMFYKGSDRMKLMYKANNV